jgi:hypothetical protein
MGALSWLGCPACCFSEAETAYPQIVTEIKKKKKYNELMVTNMAVIMILYI